MLRDLPKPVTFADGQRYLFGIALMIAGLVVGGLALGMLIFLSYLFFEAPEHSATILHIIAGGFAAYLIMQSIVMISMAVGGPVGRVKVSANREGASFEAEDKADVE